MKDAFAAASSARSWTRSGQQGVLRWVTKELCGPADALARVDCRAAAAARRRRMRRAYIMDERRPLDDIMLDRAQLRIGDSWSAGPRRPVHPLTHPPTHPSSSQPMHATIHPSTNPSAAVPEMSARRLQPCPQKHAFNILSGLCSQRRGGLPCQPRVELPAAVCRAPRASRPVSPSESRRRPAPMDRRRAASQPHSPPAAAATHKGDV